MQHWRKARNWICLLLPLELNMSVKKCRRDNAPISKADFLSIILHEIVPMTPRCNLYHKWCIFFGKVHNFLSRWCQCEIRKCCFLPWVNCYLSTLEDKRCWLLWIVMRWGFNSHMFIWKGNLLLWSCVVGIFPKRYEKISVYLRQPRAETNKSFSKTFPWWTNELMDYFQDHGWLGEWIIVKTFPAWMVTQNGILCVLCPPCRQLSPVIVTVLYP